MARRAPAGLDARERLVPLHPARRRERGYDQERTTLAQRVARTLDLPVGPKVLSRIRRTKQQALLEREARLANVMGAFQCRQPVEDESILLVDDVTTTGATLEAAALPLIQAGAAAIHGMTFAWAR